MRSWVKLLSIGAAFSLGACNSATTGSLNKMSGIHDKPTGQELTVAEVSDKCHPKQELQIIDGKLISSPPKPMSCTISMESVSLEEHLAADQ